MHQQNGEVMQGKHVDALEDSISLLLASSCTNGVRPELVDTLAQNQPVAATCKTLMYDGMQRGGGIAWPQSSKRSRRHELDEQVESWTAREPQWDAAHAHIQM